MERKQCNLTALILSVISFIFGIVSELFLKAYHRPLYAGSLSNNLTFFRDFSVVMQTFIPALLLLTLIFLLIGNKGERKFSSKWGIATFVLLYISVLSNISAVIGYITAIRALTGYEVLHLLMNLVTIAGYAILGLTLLKASLWKLVPIGFGALALVEILTLFTGAFTAYTFFYIIALALLGVITTVALHDKINRISRTVAVILLAIYAFTNSSFGFLAPIAFIILAFLMVPGTLKINIKKASAIVYGVLAILSLLLVVYYAGESLYGKVLEALVCLGGLVALAISFYKGIQQKITVIGFGLLATSFAMSVFGGSGFDMLYGLSETFHSGLFKVLSMVMLLLITVSTNVAKNKKLRTAAVTFAVLGGLFSLIMPIAYDFTLLAVFEIVFAALTVIVSIIMVPLVYTEYQGIGKHIFLSLITVGIWLLIWIYQVTQNLNKVVGMKKRSPKKELLLCMFLPFYVVYWNYKTAQYVDKYAADNGKSSKLAIPALAFSFVVSIIPQILLQDKINEIVGK